jgi:hypothetical protein
MTMSALKSVLPALILLACTPDRPSPQTQRQSQAISAEESTAALCFGVSWARYNVAQAGAQSTRADLSGPSATAMPLAKAELDRNMDWLARRGLITAEVRPGPRGNAAFQAVGREIEKGRAAMLACAGASEAGGQPPSASETTAGCATAEPCRAWQPR